MEQNKAILKKSGNGSGERVYPGGPLDATISDGSLAIEFMTAAKNVEEAMARTIFRDERHLNSALALHRKLVKFHNSAGLNTYLLKLNGLPSIGGYNRSTAALVGTGIIASEALGVKLGKDSLKFIEKQATAKAIQGNTRQEPQNE